jgi:hypothetical protein
MKDMAASFWDAFNRSLVIQALITLILVCVIAYLYCTGQPVPQDLITFFGLILGYYFGSKTGSESVRAARSIISEVRKLE